MWGYWTRFVEHREIYDKWSDNEVPNAGIFLQMLRNPLVEEEYATYISLMIESKRTQGEQTVEGESTVFRKFEGFGDDGAYSTEGGKYFWRLGEDIVFQIAFNAAFGPEEQYKIARTIAKEMTERYING
jgi:hypothetical protein